MNQWLFSGRVHPERANFNLSDRRSDVTWPAAGRSASITYQINHSQINGIANFTVSVTPFTARNDIEQVLRLCVDSLCFLHGAAWEVEVTTVRSWEGAPIVLGVKWDDVTWLEGPPTEDEIMNAMKVAPQLANSLADLRRAVRYPIDSAFHCFRAVDGLRGFFRTGSESSDKEWSALSKAINADACYVEELRGFATAQRHGELFPTTAEQSTDWYCRARTVVGRFVRYVNGGRVELVPPSFERLT